MTVGRRIAQRAAICVHVAREPFQVVHRANIPVTTPARTLLDLTRTEPRKVARRAVNQALVQRKVTIPMLYRESNFRLGGWEVDFWIPDRNLVIEMDSVRFHDNAFQRATDEQKQSALEAAGHRVERLRWHDLLCATPTILGA